MKEQQQQIYQDSKWQLWYTYWSLTHYKAPCDLSTLLSYWGKPRQHVQYERVTVAYPKWSLANSVTNLRVRCNNLFVHVWGSLEAELQKQRGVHLRNKLHLQSTHIDNMIILHFRRDVSFIAMHLVSLCCGPVDRDVGVGSLLSRAVDHGVLLAGALKAGRRPADGPIVRARHRGLDVPLHEVEQWIPPGVGEVVVRRAFQSLSRTYKLPFKITVMIRNGFIY